METNICAKCGAERVWDGLQWTCVECIRVSVAFAGHRGQPVTRSWVGHRLFTASCDSGRKTFPIKDKFE